MYNETDIFYIRDNDYSLLVGAGIEYGFRNGLAARLDVTSFDADAHSAGLALLYRLGRGPVRHADEVAIDEESKVVQQANGSPKKTTSDKIDYGILFDSESAELDLEALMFF